MSLSQPAKHDPIEWDHVAAIEAAAKPPVAALRLRKLYQKMPGVEITPDLLLQAYAAGIFPMADSHEDPQLYWIDPDLRGVLPLDGFHLPQRLRRTLRQGVFAVTCDADFPAVIRACAAPGPGRDQTWINQRIIDLYTALFDMGFCHTVECRLEGRLVGGLYGLSLGGAFFGESMFSCATDASKVALAHLVARLRAGGYTLLDTQFVTKHLRQFGAIEIPRADYHKLLTKALRVRARFPAGLEAGVSGFGG